MRRVGHAAGVERRHERDPCIERQAEDGVQRDACSTGLRTCQRQLAIGFRPGELGLEHLEARRAAGFEPIAGGSGRS